MSHWSQGLVLRSTDYYTITFNLIPYIMSCRVVGLDWYTSCFNFPHIQKSKQIRSDDLAAIVSSFQSTCQDILSQEILEHSPNSVPDIYFACKTYSTVLRTIPKFMEITRMLTWSTISIYAKTFITFSSVTSTTSFVSMMKTSRSS